MSDFIIIDGDKAVFQPAFGVATVTVQPGTIRGSGASTFNSKKVCIVGDEDSVSVPGCAYVTPAFPTPGTGTLKIASLAGNQKAQHTFSNDKKMLLKGGQFQAKLEVTSPASNPSPATDPSPQYSGQGQFVTTNTKYKGT